MFKAVAVEKNDKESRKKIPVWKRIANWYEGYLSKHNRSLNDRDSFNAVGNESHDINGRIAAGHPEIYVRQIMR